MYSIETLHKIVPGLFIPRLIILSQASALSRLREEFGLPRRDYIRPAWLTALLRQLCFCLLVKNLRIRNLLFYEFHHFWQHHRFIAKEKEINRKFSKACITITNDVMCCHDAFQNEQNNA